MHAFYSTLGKKQKKVDQCVLEASLVCLLNSRTIRATLKRPCFKKSKNKQEGKQANKQNLPPPHLLKSCRDGLGFRTHIALQEGLGLLPSTPVLTPVMTAVHSPLFHSSPPVLGMLVVHVC